MLQTKFNNMYKLIYAVCDVETGGLNNLENPICEISICFFDNELNDVSEYSSIIKPYNPILKYNEEALRINGLTMNQLNLGKDSKIVVNELCDLLNKQKMGRERCVFIAHNKKFDLGFMIEFFKFHNKDFMDFINLDYMIDTMYLSRSAFPESINYKLGSCLTNAGIETDAQHRASVDAKVTAELAKYFISNLRNKSKSEKIGRVRDTFEM